MNFSYDSQGTNTYLVYEIEDESSLDTMSLGMLKNNKINGFMPIIYTQMDDKKYIKYNVSSKISAQQFFSGPVNKKRLLGLFEGIIEAFLAAEDYMIDTSTILLDMDYIYIDVSSCKASLICLPVYGSTAAQPDMAMFFKNLMFSTQFDQSENCDHVAQIINFLNRSPMIVLEDFKALIDQLIGKSQEQPQAAAPAPMPNVAPAPVQPQAPTPAPTPAPAPAPMQAARPAAPVAPAAQASAPAGFNSAVPPLSGASAVNGIPVPGKTPTQGGMPVNPFSAPNAGGGNINKGSMPKAPAGAPQGFTGAPGAPAMDPNEKKIGLMGLLAHYNKENAELYKAQKAAKKANAEIAKTQGGNKAPQARGAQVSAPMPGGAGFAIPGQPNSINGMPQAQPQMQPQAGRPMQPQMQPQAGRPMQPQMQPQAGRPMQPQMQPQMQMHAPVQPKLPSGAAMDFGDTVVIRPADEIGETMVIQPGGQ